MVKGFAPNQFGAQHMAHLPGAGIYQRRPLMRKRPRPQPDRALTLTPLTLDCPDCQHRTHADYNNFRTVTTLDGVLRLTLTIRRCPNPACLRSLPPQPPEAPHHIAFPPPEFALE